MRKLALGSMAAAFVLAVLVGFAFAGDEAKHKKDKMAKLGAEAPQFSLQDQEGKTVNLADHAGKVVVLEWFNEECPYVVRLYKNGEMNNLAKKYADQDVVWLAINTTKGKSNSDNKAIASQWNVDRPILNDSDGHVGKMYGAKTTPHMYIIDKEGKLVYNGAIDNDPQGKKSEDKVNYVDKALGEVVAGSSVSEAQTKPYGCSIKY